MRCVKKGLALLLAVCLLCGTFADSVLATEIGSNSTVTGETDSSDNPDNTAESLEETEETDDGSDDSTDNSDETDTTGSNNENGESDEKSDAKPKESGDDEADNKEANNDTDENLTNKETSESDEVDEEILIDEDAILLSDTGDVGEVSRIEWLSALTDTFGMSVAKDNYPDNYYSDIDSSSPNYYEIMLATEFGLIDVEAGDALLPDEPATREFAAHTLNICLGYIPDDNNYTFNEYNEVTYPADIQIAIEHDWFKLTGNNFLPGEPITLAEKNAMLVKAAKILEDETIDPNYDSSYKFASDVIVLPDNTEAVLTGENELTIYNCETTLHNGDKFAIVTEGMPTVFKAVDITSSESKSVVKFEYVEMEEAFETLDVEGILSGDLAAAQVYNDNVDLNYIVGGTEKEEWEDGTKYDTLEEVGDREISAIEAVVTYDISDEVKKEFELGEGMKATITCKVGNVTPSYAVHPRDAYFDVNAKVTFSCNVSFDVLEAMGVAPKMALINIPIAFVGYFKVELDLTAKGGITMSLVENVSMGVHYSGGSFRMTKNFTKDSFTVNVHAEVNAGITASAGIDVLGALKGSIYGKLGAKGVFDSETYSDGKTPFTCAHVSAWLYALVGCDVSIDLPVYKDSCNKEYNIYTEKNSPVRVQFHYEDGVAVPRCTRETVGGNSNKRWKYYTPADSKYGYNGASSGIGSNGEPYTIFEYSLDEYNHATITSYQGNVSALSIPETLDGYTVVGIGNSVFEDNKLLRVVVIPDSVEKIGNRTFGSCINLSSVTLSKSLISMGYGVFYNCDSLTAINIPKSLSSAGSSTSTYYGYYGVFDRCDGLKNVTFENGTTKIVENLFWNCTGIEEITIPDTVTSIENTAFRSCSNLQKVSIPNSVTEIGDYAFYECGKLTEIVIPDNVTNIGNVAFGACTNLSSATLSKGLTSMGYGVFYNCDSLTEINIPKSLSSAGSSTSTYYGYYGVFDRCDGLKNVTFENGTTKIVEKLFWNCTGIEEITIPDTVTSIENNAFRSCSNLQKVSIPNFVTKIDDYAFYECGKLTEIVIPDSITNIGNVAFGDCTNLSSVTLSKSLTSMGYGAFYNCDSLIEINIPKSLSSVDGRTYYGYYGTFDRCDGLKNVTFEDGTTKIVENLFWNCTGIEEITIPNTVTSIEGSAFRNCENLQKVIISNSVLEIEDYAFQDCKSLTEILIPGSVVSLGSYAFSGCVTLPKIELPNSITSIGTYIFSGCNSLQETVLSDAITSIPASAFRDCVSLETINFPENLENIRTYAFYNTNLTEAVLPNKLKTIENYAFYNCDGLTKVEMSNGITSIGNYAFYDCDALTKVVIPDSVTSLGTYIFADCELLSDVTLGTGITTIPTYAFNLCPSLQKIVLTYRVTTINNNAFTNCTSLTEITIPRATITIASSVFSYPTRLTIYGVSGTYAETYANNIGATFVNREVKATEVSLTETDIKVVKGKTAALVMSVTPSDFTDEVSWKSTDTSVVTVSDAGIVTAKAIGTATIKVTVGDISDSCNVTVTQPVTSISLNKSSLSLEAWDSEKLTATVSPSNADNKDIEWSTSDETIATVDENGLVTALAKGTATITVTALDGSGVSRNCTVTVVNNGYICDSVSELESEHNYSNNSSDYWLYTIDGAEKLYVTFDEQTNIEEGFDYLYIYDKNGKEIGKYTGTQLAGKTVEVTGDTVKVKLVSDDSGTAWGFKITSVTLSGNNDNMGDGGNTGGDDTPDNDEFLVTFDTQGGSSVGSVKVTKNTPVAEPKAPTKPGYTFLGWYLDGEAYDFSQPVTSNIVLQAKWERIVTDPEPGDGDEIPDEDKPEDGIIPDGLWIAGVADQTYTGKALKPDVRVYDGNLKLKAGSDYTVSYKNNTKASYDFNEDNPPVSAPRITVKGKGNYSGSTSAVFKIAPIDISDSDLISVDDLAAAYDGKVQKKAPTVTFNGKKLSAKKDFTVSYPDTQSGAYQDKGIYTVRIDGTGNFIGSIDIKLEITDKQLIEKAKTLKISDKIYDDGNEIELSDAELVMYMKSKNEPMSRGVDYTVRYENNREVGTASAIITGIGSYAGTKRVNFKIVGTPINKAQVEGIENKVYNGSKQVQNVTVKINGVTLTDGEDYVVSYDNCVNAGTARLTIQGIGAYSGTVKKTFKITAYDLSADGQNKLSGLTDNLTVGYAAGGSKPKLDLKFADSKLTEGIDYKLSYSNNKNIATGSDTKAPTITIKGKGNFKGTLKMNFSIIKKNLADTEDPICVVVPDVAYSNSAGKCISKPILTHPDGKALKAGNDYDVSYTLSDGVTEFTKNSRADVGTVICATITGKGKYEGTVMTTYKVRQNDFAKAKIKIVPKSYTGSKIYLTENDVTATLGNAGLTYGRDYEIIDESYVNNVKKGTATVKIRGLGDYGGVKTVKFKIQAKKMVSFDSIVRKLLQVN